MHQLITYLLVAMTAWVPVRNLTAWGESKEDVLARYESIANDVASVALDPDEPPVFTGAAGRTKTALLVMSVASFEGGFQKFVDDGECNDSRFSADRRGGCDGGRAYTIWQLHAREFGGGFVLLSDGRLSSARYATAAELASHEVLGPAALIADRKVAARVAQRLLRQSLKTWGSLCSYSGESCEPGRHPKADARLDRAKRFFAQHEAVDPAGS